MGKSIYTNMQGWYLMPATHLKNYLKSLPKSTFWKERPLKITCYVELTIIF